MSDRARSGRKILAMTPTDVATSTIAPTSVRDAANRFAEALASTDAFLRLETAQDTLLHDEAAQGAVAQLQELHQQLGWRARAGALTEVEQARLAELEQTLSDQPAVRELEAAELQVQEEAGAAAAVLVEAAGVGFPGGGCC